jgi:transcriptional regulator with XRE-family HTH domain
MAKTSCRKGFFAERLKALRLQAGLTQEQLSERSGLALSTVFQFEQGLKEPTYGTLIKLTRGLGVPLGAFEQEMPRQEKK